MVQFVGNVTSEEINLHARPNYTSWMTTTSACEEHFFSCLGFMPTQTVFLKTTNLPKVMLVTIALTVSYALEKP